MVIGSSQWTEYLSLLRANRGQGFTLQAMPLRGTAEFDVRLPHTLTVGVLYRKEREPHAELKSAYYNGHTRLSGGHEIGTVFPGDNIQCIDKTDEGQLCGRYRCIAACVRAPGQSAMRGIVVEPSTRGCIVLVGSRSTSGY